MTIIRLESPTRPTLCNIISTLFESLRLVVQLVPTSQGIERMNMTATVQTWSEAMDAGVLQAAATGITQKSTTTQSRNF